MEIFQTVFVILLMFLCKKMDKDNQRERGIVLTDVSDEQTQVSVQV